MEKLSKKLRERCDSATKAANDESEPDSYWHMGEAQAYSNAAQFTEAYEAAWKARVEVVVAELRLWASRAVGDQALVSGLAADLVTEKLSVPE